MFIFKQNIYWKRGLDICFLLLRIIFVKNAGITYVFVKNPGIMQVYWPKCPHLQVNLGIVATLYVFSRLFLQGIPGPV